MKAEDSATLIWDALASRVGLTKPQLMLLTGLTPSQFNRGVTHIKDVFQEEYVQPISIDPRTHQYSLAAEWREVRDYANTRLKSMTSQARRFSHTVAAAEKWPKSPAARRARRDVLRLVDDLEDLQAEVLDGHPAAS